MSDTQSTTSQDQNLAMVQKGLAIGSLVLAVLMPLVGLVGSIASLVWARRTGAGTKVPTWGIVVSIVMIIVGIVVGIIAFIVLQNAVRAGALDLEALCAQRAKWGLLLDSLRFVCPA